MNQQQPPAAPDPDLENRRRWRSRARKILRKLPRRSNVDRYPLVKYVGGHAKKLPYLWSWKRPQVVRSYYVGWIVTLLPAAGLQIVLALILSMVFKANITVAAGLQFVSNPFTAAPILFSTYHIGKGTLGVVGVSPAGMATGIALNLTIGAILGGLAVAAACHLAHVLLAGKGASPIKRAQIAD